MLSYEHTLEEKEAEINKYMQEMLTYIAGLTDEDVYTYGEYGIYDKNVILENARSIGSNGIGLGTREYLIDLSTEDFANDIELPGNLKTLIPDELIRRVFEEYNEKIARCSEEAYYDWWSDPTYEHVFAQYKNANLYLLEKTIGVKSYKEETTYGKQIFFYADRYHTEFDLTLPFSYMSGDLFFSYHTVIRSADDQDLNIMLFFLIPDGLGETKQSFFKAMFLIYLGSALFFSFLSWYGYKKMYSLKGKNNFYKALVNSMAKDLKEPLTDLKTCSSALNDNINTEKREYYAGEVLDEIRVINGLINKNLNLSKNNSYDLEEEEKIYFSDLVTDIKKKYEKLFADKKLTIEQKGDTYLTGNPEVLKLMAEDIFYRSDKEQQKVESFIREKKMDFEREQLLNSINVEVAGKTGTAQEGEDRPAHALFISYAPYTAPEVSVTTVIPNGYSSANAADLTGFVYAYLYDKEALNDARFTEANDSVGD